VAPLPRSGGFAAARAGQFRDGMGSLHRTGALLRRPVAVGALRIGAAVDALFDRQLTRLIGFDVRCSDGAHRFLPYPACEVCDDRIAVESALVLLDRQRGYYAVAGSAFSDLRGQEVSLDREQVGPLADLVVDAGGSVERVVVSAPDGGLSLEPGPDLMVGNNVLRPAV
jgi:hypothetical protein